MSQWRQPPERGKERTRSGRGAGNPAVLPRLPGRFALASISRPLSGRHRDTNHFRETPWEKKERGWSGHPALPQRTPRSRVWSSQAARLAELMRFSATRR